MEDPPGDELLDAFGRLGRAAVRCLAQHGEVELAPDDAGDTGQAPSPLGEPFQPPGDDFAHRGRRDWLLSKRRAVASGQRAKDLHRDKWVAFTDTPDLDADPLERCRIEGGWGQRPYQGCRLSF